MFALLADALPENSQVIVDVTHGFRSQPMLALAAGVYLRTVKNVTIDRIVYGAYEARDTHTNTAPVVDLTSFLDLIDWSVSAGQFIKYGNARPLSSLLNELHREKYAG
jgi:CRISPR-associated Csx2 family protein